MGKAEEEAIVEGIRADLPELAAEVPQTRATNPLILAGRPAQGEEWQSGQQAASKPLGGPPSCQGATGRCSGQGGPAGLRVGGCGGCDGPSTPMASRTLPGHLARVHQALTEKQGVLHRRRDDSI